MKVTLKLIDISSLMESVIRELRTIAPELKGSSINGDAISDVCDRLEAIEQLLAKAPRAIGNNSNSSEETYVDDENETFEDDDFDDESFDDDEVDDDEFDDDDES